MSRACASALLAALALAGCGSSTSSPGAPPPPGATGQSRPASGGSAAPARGVPKLIPPPGAPARSVRVPVLTYHRVAPPQAVGQADLKVDPATFAAELAALHSGGYHAIGQAQLFAALYRGASLPPKPIIISVDDGYVDDVKTILPDLQRWHMVATFFVITARFTEPGFLTADQVRQLDRAGMDIGDHTAHHVDLRRLTPSELASETSGSRKVLQRALGHFVYTFAYPFGKYDDAVVNAVHAAGFTIGYSTAGGVTERTAAPLTMPRIHVGHNETPRGLLSLLGG